MEEVTIRLAGSPGDAVRAIEEVKAALASLTDKTVRVRVAQEGMNRTSKQAQTEMSRLAKAETSLGDAQAASLQGRTQSSRDYLRAIKEEDRAWAQHVRNVEDGHRRINRARGSGGGGGRRLLGGQFPPEGFNSSNFLGADLGRSGVRPRTLGIGVGAGALVGLIKPLESLLGLAGAVPAAMGAAGIAVAAFHSIGGKALSKVVEDQAKATEKFKAGTITAEAYHKAMKNALVGVSDEQKKALPFFEQWHDTVLKTSEAMARKMLPALRDLGAGLKANKGIIVGAFGTGAGSIAGAMGGISTFLQSRQGQAGVGALASSSTNMLAGFSSGAVNGFRAFLDIARAARPLVNKLSEDITRITAQFAAWTGSFRGQKAMTQFFLDGEEAAGKFLRVIGNVGMAIHNIGGGVGNGFLDWLVQITQRFQEWTENEANVDRLAAALKRVADTLLVIGQAIGTAAPKLAQFADFMTKTLGPNTLGWLLIGKSLGAGKLGGALGKGLLGNLGGKATAGAAGGAAAGGGGIAGMLGGAAALAPIIAGVALVGAGIGTILLITSKTKADTDELSRSWDKVGGAIARAKGAAALVAGANRAQRQRIEEGNALRGGIPGAKLALFDAQDRLKADKAALGGLVGKDRERMKLQIDVDSQAVKDAQKDLQDLRRELGLADAATNRHADDSREAGRAIQGAADEQRSALERVTDAAKKTNDAISRNGRAAPIAAQGVKDFSAKMNAAAAALDKTNPKAAEYARTAATLAKNIGRIPSSKEVKVTIEGLDSAAYNLDHIRNLLLSIKSKTVRLSVINSVSTINPGGAHGGTGGADGDPKTPAMTGAKITSPMTIVGEQAPTHPEFVIATNPAYRARNQKLMAQAASSMGGEVNFFQAGGVLSGGKATPGTAGGATPPGGVPGRPKPADPLAGVKSALGEAAMYAQGSGSIEGTNAAAKYAGIPGKLAALRKQIARLTKMIRGDDQFLEHEKDVVLTLQRKQRAEKDKGKKESIRRQIEDITHHVVPGRKSARKGRVGKIAADNKAIDALTEQLGIVPGSAAFQALIDIVEGEQIAASEANRPDLATALKGREVADYKKRIGFLMAFTGAKSTQRDKNLWAAAASELKGRRGELDSLTEVEDTGGGGGGAGGGDTSAQDADNQQALAMLAELANYARQGRLSDLIGDEELKTAMQFISAQVGSFAKGSPFIAKSGLATVHYGEAIVDAASNQRNNKTGPLEGTITLEGSDDLTRALAKALGGQVNVTLGRDARRRRREGQS